MAWLSSCNGQKRRRSPRSRHGPHIPGCRVERWRSGQSAPAQKSAGRCSGATSPASSSSRQGSAAGCSSVNSSSRRASGAQLPGSSSSPCNRATSARRGAPAPTPVHHRRRQCSSQPPAFAMHVPRLPILRAATFMPRSVRHRCRYPFGDITSCGLSGYSHQENIFPSTKHDRTPPLSLSMRTNSRLRASGSGTPSTNPRGSHDCDRTSRQRSAATQPAPPTTRRRA